MVLSKRHLDQKTKNEKKNAFDNPEVIIWIVLVIGIIAAIANIYRKIT